MKIFEIYDEENNLNIGALLYFEKIKRFVVELQDYLDEWTAPLLFTSHVKRGIFTIPAEYSLLWVRERIIPSGRQNISAILQNHKMEVYDEMAFLEISRGRCCQDALMIRKTMQIPHFVLERQKRNLREVVALENQNLLCFFRDESVKRVDLHLMACEQEANPHLMDREQKADYCLQNCKQDVEIVLTHDKVFQSAEVGVGGYCVMFNRSIEIPSWILYRNGENIPLTLNDFLTFAKSALSDTGEAGELLNCTRQNLSYMVKQKELTPIREDVRGNLYLKGDLLEKSW